MRRFIPILLLLATAGPIQAHGIMVPKEKEVPPLAMVNHLVTINIEDQVANTVVEQSFRNHTDRQLEATYIFPVPKGASVNDFVMWVGGKKVKGEMVEAKKARKIYTDIVRRTQDPGLLEYMGHNLFKMRVFPIPARGEQKVRLQYTSIAPSDNGTISYIYPLKTDGKAVETLEKFSIKMNLKSQHTIQNIYSPTHAITVSRKDDKNAVIHFSKDQGLLDRDFLLYYNAGNKDVGLTMLNHRPTAGNKGYFLMLVSPRAELAKDQQVPRDVVFVLDTSGSMRGKRIQQAKGALNFCLGQLSSQDRFGIINFATTVNKYTEGLQEATKDNLGQAQKWVRDLQATGGTAINDALASALSMRSDDSTRTFTMVFFTDGRPTIGETDHEKILKNVMKENTENTRIFTFGVGNDVNATMLDQMAEQSRALSTYVQEAEEFEDKVSSLYNKISHPVLTNLNLSVGDDVKLSEVYPPQLPDLFHGNQLVVLGRYEGKGHVAVKLSGQVGKKDREFVYEVNFAEKSSEEKPFVEELWAHRKVGYLLDQIRINGEKKELVQEVVSLAKRYGITTPYTSYLIVPDAPIPVARVQNSGTEFKRRPNVAFDLNPGISSVKSAPSALKKPSDNSKDEKGGDQSAKNGPSNKGKAKQITVKEFAQKVQGTPGAASKFRGQKANEELSKVRRETNGPKANNGGSVAYGRALWEARQRLLANMDAQIALKKGQKDLVQNGYLGVALSMQSNNLRNQCQLTQTAICNVQSRNCLNVGGVWIDEGYHAKMKTVTVKAMSPAYFRILERHPMVKEVYTMGNHFVWVTPSGTALIIDTSAGSERLEDLEIDALF